MSNYHKQDPTTIQSMFNSIAKRYDLTNAILSLQMHKHWNRTLVKKLVIADQPHAFLDLCCGTGDIAFRYLKETSAPCHAYLLDFCINMLNCAKQKSSQIDLKKHYIHYVEADAQELPLKEESIDCAAMAYGIRNIKDPVKSLKEIYRVLKPGGRVGILELTRPTNPLLRLGHQFYLRILLPIIGKWLTDNKEAYEYLCNSIHTFIPPKELEDLLVANGFTHTYRQSLAGGIATILVGHKN